MVMSMASALIVKPAPCGLQRAGIISPNKLPPRRRSSARRGTRSDTAHVASDSKKNIRHSCCSSRITNTARNGVDSYTRAFHAGAVSSAAAMPATSGTRLDGGARKTSPRSTSTVPQPNDDNWIETWISAAIRRQREVENEVLEDKDTQPAVMTTSNVDLSERISYDRGVSDTDHACPPHRVSSARGSTAADNRFRSSSCSIARPNSATARLGHRSHAPGWLETRVSRRPASAGAGATRLEDIRSKLDHWRPLQSRRPTSQASKGIDQARRYICGDRDKYSTKACGRQIEPTWSYKGPKRSEEDLLPRRRILVKVPHVAGELRNTGVPYRLAWNAELAGGEAGDVSDRQCCDMVGVDSVGTDAAVVFPRCLQEATEIVKLPPPMEWEHEYFGNFGSTDGSTVGSVLAQQPPAEDYPRTSHCLQEAREVIKPPRPMGLDDVYFGSFGSTDGSTVGSALAPQPRAEDNPRTSRVIAQLRASVLREQKSSAAGVTAPLSTTSRFFQSPSDRQSHRGAGVPCLPNSERLSARGNPRPYSAREGTKTSSVHHWDASARPSRLRQRVPGSIGGSWVNEAGRSGERARSKTATVDRDWLRRGRASAGCKYSLFPSTVVTEGEGPRGLTGDAGYGNAFAPFSVGIGLGGMSDWEGSICSAD